MSYYARLYTLQYRLREWATVRTCKLRGVTSTRATVVPPNRVVFVLVGMLGDTIMCLPALEAAREIWPAAKLFAVVTPRIREMLEGIEYIDEFLIGTNDPMSIRHRESANETFARLGEHDFDVAILLGGDQYAPVFYKLGVPVRVGPEECVYRPLFTHTYSIGGPNNWGPDERLGAIRAMNYEVAEKIPSLAVSKTARAEFRAWAGGIGLPEGTQFIVIHPFGSEPRKWWPLDRIPALARRIYETSGIHSLLIGGPEVREPASTLPHTPGLISVVGSLSLRQLLATIESAELVISTDSGPYHMAGALRRPLIGLFAAIRPLHANRYPQTRVIKGDDESCYGRCGYNRCLAQSCRQLSNISADQILASIKQSLEETRVWTELT